MRLGSSRKNQSDRDRKAKNIAEKEKAAKDTKAQQ